MKTIRISEEFTIPQTDIVLEKGDIVQIQEAVSSPQLRQAFQKFFDDAELMAKNEKANTEAGVAVGAELSSAYNQFFQAALNGADEEEGHELYDRAFLFFDSMIKEVKKRTFKDKILDQGSINDLGK
jgi:hypothetical protein